MAHIQCRIELFGVPRVLAGERETVVAVPVGSSVASLLPALAAAYPVLVGRVISPERDGLVEGYVFNRDGRAFVQHLDEPLVSGETLLLLSSAAGG